MKHTVETTNSSLRMSLPEPAWSGRREIGTGIFITGIYVGPRTKRVVIETDSIWEDRNTGGCVGTKYRLVDDPSELAGLAQDYSSIRELLDQIIVAEEL